MTVNLLKILKIYEICRKMQETKYDKKLQKLPDLLRKKRKYDIVLSNNQKRRKVMKEEDLKDLEKKGT